MILVTVNPSIRHQTDNMNRPSVQIGGSNCPKQSVIFHERAILDGLGDAHDILINNSARSEVEVSHFRISHLSIRKAHRQSRSAKECIGTAIKQCVHRGSSAKRNGIMG
jgi:hypothetical protein